MSTRFELGKSYEPAAFEAEVSAAWIASRAFHAVPDERPAGQRYVIMMPLPNVTGALHMGHAMDNVMQDMLIRWHRMLGDNTLWMPGTDHAGIATQAVVEKRLKELEGLTRHDIGREGLVARIWAWKDQYQARIVSQQQRMGCSADWERQRFTMDKVCSRAVRKTFLAMFRDGLIFRGKRLVNWDPVLRTSISDDEVYHETVQGHFWHLRYPVIDPRPGEPTHVTVATTRPETMLGDTAVAVHPAPDEVLAAERVRLEAALGEAPAREREALEAQLQALIERQERVLPSLLALRDMARDGRMVMLPLAERPIPLVADEWAKPGLGSGCVKITPAHDPNDYEVWKRHAERLEILNILNPDGTLNESAGAYAGLDRFVARDRVVAELEARGLLPLIEDREIEVGHSDRSKSPIEPYLSDQWYVFMGDRPEGVVMARGTAKQHKASGLVQAAIDAANDGRVSFHPERFKKTYLDWLAEKRDWPISRQLWWGHQIPVWSRVVEPQALGEALGVLFVGPLARHWPEAAAARLVHKDSGESWLVTGPDFVAPAALTEREGEWLLDLCLYEDDEEALAALEARGFARDPDVLDTWFSSALWPHSTLGWPEPSSADAEGGAPMGAAGPHGDCLDYYYPGSCLVTARDIITLWVARMVLMGLYNVGDIPFSDVFVHANILDGSGERMSKSKGNGIDPVDIIQGYGTDAMRFVLCDMQTGNQDIRLPVTAVCPHCAHHNDLTELKKQRESVFTFPCQKCGGQFDVLGTMPEVPRAQLISERFQDGRSFCTKLWNTARFVLGHLDEVQDVALTPADLAVEDRWILASLNAATRAVTEGLRQYNPSVALGAARDFMWGDLCDWYLELVKPRLAEGDSRGATVARLVLAHTLNQTLRLLHPFVPFLTEHIYGSLVARVGHEGLRGLTPVRPAAPLLIGAEWPAPAPSFDDEALRTRFQVVQALTSAVREVRASQGVSPAQPLEVTLRPPAERVADLRSEAHIVERLARVSALHIDPAAERPKGAASKVVADIQIFVHDVVDEAKERERLTKQMEKIVKEIEGLDKRLSNEGFTSRAPAEVVAEQRLRLERFEAQRQAIEEALASL